MGSWFAVRIACFLYLTSAFLIVIFTHASCSFHNIVFYACFFLCIRAVLFYYNKKDSKINISMDNLEQVNTPLRGISQF